MIDVLEIRDQNRITIGILDLSKSVIWHSVYYGVGDFEIYIQATPENIALLQVGNYVTRYDNDEVGIIESITVEYSAQDGYMLTASGRFAKSLLNRRIIYNLNGTVNTPTILRGKVETAVRGLVRDNAINCPFDSRRNIPILGLGSAKGYTDIIVDENGQAAGKQVSYQPLREYTDEVLREYGMSAKVTLKESNKMLLYGVFRGADRSMGNSSGNEPIIFSTDYDNLISSTYLYDSQSLKNAALVGGEGEGLERFFTLLTASESGLQLREMFVDASDINKEREVEESEEPVPYTDAEYRTLLVQKGQQILKDQIIEETFTGDVNVQLGLHKLGEDYSLGDIVTVQDNYINKYINVRITEVTEVQDDNGYKVDIVFGV